MMAILKRIFGSKPDEELAERAGNLLGINPKAKTRPGQKVPQELVARMHQLSMLTGSNTAIGYELDDYRRSWDEFYRYFDNNINRVSAMQAELQRLKR